LVAVETPCAALVVTPSKKMGRPLLQYDKLSKEGRRTRDYRARLAEQHVPLLMVPLLEAAAAVDAEEVAQKEADQAARRQRLIDREQSTLSESLSDGTSGLRLRDAARPHAIVAPAPHEPPAPECGLFTLCLEAADLGALAAEPRPMRCCGAFVCTLCLRSHFKEHGQRLPVHYGDGVNGESGRVVSTDPVDRHTCPFCRQPVLSVQKAFGGRQ